MNYCGNLTEDQTIDWKFSTVDTDNAPITLDGSPAVSIYKANDATQSTAGVTLSVDFDGVTGLHHVRIDTSADAFYAVGNDYQAVITSGTVDGISVVGSVLFTFSIENRFMEADVTKIGGDAQSATDLKDFADAGYDPSTNKVQGVVLVDTLTTYTGNTPQTGDAYARLGAPAGASHAADIAAVKAETATIVVDTNELQADWANGGRLDLLVDGILADTAEIGTAGAGLTALPWNASWDAEVQSECTDALNAYDPPTKAELDSAVSPLATSAEIAALNNLDSTAVQSAAAAALTAYDPPTKAELDSAVDALPTASENAAAVLAGGDVDGFSLEETLKLCLAALAGKLSGAATTTITIRSADDSADRVVATVDSDGNRTALTLDATG